jgi:hypothetical protein
VVHAILCTACNPALAVRVVVARWQHTVAMGSAMGLASMSPTWKPHRPVKLAHDAVPSGYQIRTMRCIGNRRGHHQEAIMSAFYPGHRDRSQPVARRNLDPKIWATGIMLRGDWVSIQYVASGLLEVLSGPMRYRHIPQLNQVFLAFHINSARYRSMKVLANRWDLEFLKTPSMGERVTHLFTLRQVEAFMPTDTAGWRGLGNLPRPVWADLDANPRWYVAVDTHAFDVGQFCLRHALPVTCYPTANAPLTYFQASWTHRNALRHFFARHGTPVRAAFGPPHGQETYKIHIGTVDSR